MQKKIYFIKERVKQIAENKGIPLGKFFKELEVSSTGFSGEKLKKGINSDTIQKLISIYPDVDLNWLITGESKPSSPESKETPNLAAEPAEAYSVDFKDKYIQVLEENKHLQEKFIKLLESLNQ